MSSRNIARTGVVGCCKPMFQNYSIYGAWDCREWSSVLQTENQMDSISICSTRGGERLYNSTYRMPKNPFVATKTTKRNEGKYPGCGVMAAYFAWDDGERFESDILV